MEKDLFLIERDGYKTHDLQSSDLGSILEGCKDLDALDVYHMKVRNQGRKILEQYTVLKVKEENTDGVLSICLHAGQRYVQRQIGIANEIKAMEYYKDNMSKINQEIIDKFTKSARKVWDDGDTFYWFDDDNFMYITSKAPVPELITLYQEDFGWDKQQNRWLVENQLSKLAKSKDQLDYVINSSTKIIESNEEQIRSFDSKVSSLQEKIKVVEAKKASLVSKNEELSKIVEYHQKQYNDRFDRLFKDWKGNPVRK